MRHELRTVKGVCPHDCPDTCGLVIRVDEQTGRAVELRGDREHPFTRGFLCRKVSKYLERVYHPERLQHPMRRVGRKGEGRAVVFGTRRAARRLGNSALPTSRQRLGGCAALDRGGHRPR